MNRGVKGIQTQIKDLKAMKKGSTVETQLSIDRAISRLEVKLRKHLAKVGSKRGNTSKTADRRL